MPKKIIKFIFLILFTIGMLSFSACNKNDSSMDEVDVIENIDMDKNSKTHKDTSSGTNELIVEEANQTNNQGIAFVPAGLFL